MDAPRNQYSGADIQKATGVFSGTLYPALLRFESAGMLKSRWENVDPRKVGRPRKRLYEITGHGINVANETFNELGIPLHGNALA